jgi:hypothetical protein
MAVYNLTGAGTVGLTAGTSRLIVDVTTFTPNRTIGRATPPNYYDLGLLRLGVQGSFGITQPVDAASMFMDCPDGVTTLGYSLFGTTAIRVTEQFANVTHSLQPWDRNPTVVSLYAAATAPANSGTTQLWTHTVPAQRIFRVCGAEVLAGPFAPGAAAQNYCNVYVSIAGAPMLMAVAAADVSAPVIASLPGGNLDLPAGQTIAAYYANGTATSVDLCLATCVGYEFDA